MELASSFLLNEDILQQLPESKKSLFVLEWLRHLHRILQAANRSDVKSSQKQLQEQLIKQMLLTPGPPVRYYLAKCLAALFAVGDSVGLFDIINVCNDQVKQKDDPALLSQRLAALEILGEMYEKLGRMVGRSYEETVTVCLRNLKSAESQTRIEIMKTLEKVITGMGSAAASHHREIHKHLRTAMTDRIMAVREAAARCLEALARESTFLYTVELESCVSLACRAMENSTYDVRCAVASFVAAVLSAALTASHSGPTGKNAPTPAAAKLQKVVTVDEVLSLLASMFLRGGVGFLKTGASEMIRGTTVVPKEVRIGTAHCYMAFLKRMGPQWLEKNLAVVLNSLIDLVGNPRSNTTHVDTIYARKCVTCIVRASVGGLLGEKAQLVAGRELVNILYKYATAPDVLVESGAAERNADTRQHILICALEQLQTVIMELDSVTVNLTADAGHNLIDVTLAIVVYPSPNVQLAAAWTLRNIVSVLPTQMVPILNRLLSKIEDTKTFPEGIVGYSYGLAAVIGGISDSPLGIPHRLVERAFNLAEELLRSAASNSRLSQQRTEAAWMILGAITSLGSASMRKYLPKYRHLWRNSFPRSDKEIESERKRGDAFTWQVSLQNRAGALAAIHGFLVNCPELVTEDVLSKIMVSIEGAIALLGSISEWIKSYGQHMKVHLAAVRVRLYEILLVLPAKNWLCELKKPETVPAAVIKGVVDEFTLSDNASNTTTSLLRALCRNEDALLLGHWLQDTDQKLIEEQLQPNSASGSGSLEHDATTLYQKSDDIPTPLPIGVAVIDLSLQLFGRMFPYLAAKHQQQILEHLLTCVQQAKTVRQQAMLINVFTAMLAALKSLVEMKAEPPTEPVVNGFINLINTGIRSPSPMLRCAAGEALGRLAQVVNDRKFVADTVQRSFDMLRTSRDIISRTGHCMILGCLHRYVGAMASNQHLNSSVSILMALSEDINASVVQTWSLHALYLIADSGGPMFRSYVEPTLSLCVKLLLVVPRHHNEVFQCIGKCLSALITAVGPELDGAHGTISAVRNTCLIACEMLHSCATTDWIVQSEAVTSFQQMHMFAPKHVNFTLLVPQLVNHLSSPHLLLRQSSIDCLRQLCQRETGQVCDIARNTQESVTDDELWLAMLLFNMLDSEKDPKIRSGIQLIFQSILLYATESHLSAWFALSREILTTSDVGGKSGPEGITEETDENAEDDVEEFRAKAPGDSEPKRNNARWTTRVYAVSCLRKLIVYCREAHTFHLDVTRSRKEHHDALILHLSDLVRMAFMGATSESDQLRMGGLELLLDIIVNFAAIEEPEFPGHGILEQYQAQVGAALRPAFTPETPPYITAKACDVCSRWIASGVARDINDLRRVYQLLVQSLDKLKISLKDAKIPYSEASVTLEKLAILKAWAEIYVEAIKWQKQYEEMLALVQPHVASLSRSWLAAIRDQAFLSLPAEFSNQLPVEGGAFYSVESIDAARKCYQNCWLPILYATVTWWSGGGGYENVLLEKPDSRLAVQDGGNLGLATPRAGVAPLPAEEINRARFSLFFGAAMEALCQSRSDDISDDQSMITCLKAAQTVLELDWSKAALCTDMNCPRETLNIMHRVVLTRENPAVQAEALQVVKSVLQAASDCFQQENRKKNKDGGENTENETTVGFYDIGEGGASGEINPAKSTVFAAAEVFFCILIRKFPSLNPTLRSISLHQNPSQNQPAYIQLSAATISCLPNLLGLCSHRGTLSVFPVILHILLTALRQLVEDNVPCSDPRCLAIIQCLRTLSSSAYLDSPVVGPEWEGLLRSTILRLTDIVKSVFREKSTTEASVSLMLAASVIILTAPERVTRVGNIFYPCVNMFKQFLNVRNVPGIQMQTLQMLGQIFFHPNKELAAAYIRHLAGDILISVDGNVNKVDVKNIEETLLVTERLKLLENVVEAAEPRQRDAIIRFIAPVFIAFLQEPGAVKGHDYLARLHAFCLNRLQKMAPGNPEGFRAAIARNPELKSRLESALAASSGAQKSAVNMNSTPKTARRIVAAGAEQPSIKLKMDFSNFS
ncbi:HEAT repeat-containing protein 5B-like isoform X2 [Paramacrobiotus metropolitanus]|nr:HEAT repeat-containing protein 5B-like isoform X2 [Paramacrobiotus metropolitanus]XP_055352554.1 HEAT repeat-containing protein 5B-like isoform X2 [Paramacrobiotus metropolitanus]XP_055352562.1 HEAT repeat-containing protein 5B-like isoform X2 [Paramacrobiotus metropolitanus]XP_055352566.1 HEAT repeat-containing protein 5B-like isoform X2 [Paramacrobiotus metropolitanus]